MLDETWKSLIFSHLPKFLNVGSFLTDETASDFARYKDARLKLKFLATRSGSGPLVGLLLVLSVVIVATTAAAMTSVVVSSLHNWIRRFKGFVLWGTLFVWWDFLSGIFCFRSWALRESFLFGVISPLWGQIWGSPEGSFGPDTQQFWGHCWGCSRFQMGWLLRTRANFGANWEYFFCKISVNIRHCQC